MSSVGNGGDKPSFIEQVTALVKAAEPAIRWLAMIAMAYGIVSGKISQDQVNQWLTQYTQGIGQKVAVAPASPAPVQTEQK